MISVKAAVARWEEEEEEGSQGYLNPNPRARPMALPLMMKNLDSYDSFDWRNL